MTSRSVLGPLLVGALLLGGCSVGGGDDGAQKAADALAAALSGRGDLAKVAFTTPSADVVVAYQGLTKPLGPNDPEVEVRKLSEDGDEATATLAWASPLGGEVIWEHTGTVALRRSGGTWKAVWSPEVVEKTLKTDEALTVTGLKAQRGNILGQGGTPIVEPRPVVRFGLDKTQVPAAAAAESAARIAAALDIDAGSFAKEVTQAGPRAFVEALVVRRAQASSALIGRVTAVKGGRAISDRLPLAPTKDFAAAILGTVGPATAEIITKSGGRLRAGDDTGLSGLQARYDEQPFGTRGVKVTAAPVVEEASDLAQDPVEPRVLFTSEPKAGSDLELSLDVRLQEKAQQLLERYGPASALVAIRPSSGEVLVAASGPGSDGYNTATFGQYAPGSTFKIISSLALLRSGLTPTSTVTCPSTVTVNGKVFKNYSDYPSNRTGRITLRDAVANSCNTAFISSRAKVRPGALAAAAAALGFGVDHDTGFPAYFGQVPAAQGETEAAADLIGQGRILASPLAMATVVASVVQGEAVVPWMVRGLQREQADPASPLTKAEAASLRALMHAVVTDGSGAALASLQPPQVLAKTGTAEFGTGGAVRTHTWMVGAQGDLAVAVFVDVGESGSRTAGPVLKDFLAAAR